MKVLFVGLGAAGQRHARNLRTLLGPDAQFYAYRSRGLRHLITPELERDDARDVEREYGIRAFDGLEAALALRPQIAVISNPSRMHVDAAAACARAGCDLFVEKPLADSRLGVAELARTIHASGLVAMVGFQMRFHPLFERLEQLVASDELGNLSSVRAVVGEWLPSWHRYEDYRRSYAARSDLGGGVALTQIHEYDYLAALFGMPRRLFALGGHLSDLEIDVEDTVSVLMECSRRGRTLPVHLTQDYVARPANRACEVVGDRGRLVADFVARTLTRWDAGCTQPTIERFASVDRNEPYLLEMRHFLACVRERLRPRSDVDSARASLEMALAAKRSIETRSVVDLVEAQAAHVA